MSPSRAELPGQGDAPPLRLAILEERPLYVGFAIEVMKMLQNQLGDKIAKTQGLSYCADEAKVNFSVPAKPRVSFPHELVPLASLLVTVLPWGLAISSYIHCC